MSFLGEKDVVRFRGDVDVHDQEGAESFQCKATGVFHRSSDEEGARNDSWFAVSSVGKSGGLCLPQVNEATAELQARKERESCIHGMNWLRKELNLYP